MEMFVKEQEQKITELSRQIMILSTKNKMVEQENEKLRKELTAAKQTIQKISNSEQGFSLIKKKLVMSKEISEARKQSNAVNGFTHTKTKKRNDD